MKQRRSRRKTSNHANILPSLILFVISALVFVHQCITPLYSEHRRNMFSFLSRSRPTFLFYKSRTSDYSRGNSTRSTIERKPVTALSLPTFTNISEPWTKSHDGAERSMQSTQDQWSLIPIGPFPLPPLSPQNRSRNTTLTPYTPERETHIYAGSSWTASFARHILPSLPLHWFAEITHRANNFAPPFGSNSIFRARRSGGWIGCKRPHLLICMAAYRAIKVTNALSVLSTDCHLHNDWLPYILIKLAEELRPVQLRCAVSNATSSQVISAINNTYNMIGLTAIVDVDLAAGKIPSDTDMFLVYRAIHKKTLIEAMQMLKGIKKSGGVKHLLVDTYPDVDNSGAALANGMTRVNTGTAPFWFPAPVFEYANENENSEDVDMEVVVVLVDQLFEERGTPEMKDLVDPRRRKIEER